MKEDNNPQQHGTIISPGGKLLERKSELSDVLTTFQQTFVISDALKPDIPILYASEGFYKMTGYDRSEVIGRNCRFLQGKDTDRNEVARLKQCLMDGDKYCGRLYNYRKDGTPFWNLLTVCPVKDYSGRVVKFIGMQVEVSKHTEGNTENKKRPNDLPVSLIRYQSRQEDVAKESVAAIVKTVQKPEMMPPGFNTYVPSKVDDSKGSVDGASENSERDSYEMKGTTDARKGLDLATTLERIQKNFVITDPSLPENPIIFASDDFLELTEYSREEIIGRNCRFLQGPGTDQSVVQKIRDAIRDQTDVTVQLLNYTKSGKPFWNLFHLQSVKDKKGNLKYFIGVQLDASTYKEMVLKQSITENSEAEGIIDVQVTAQNVNYGLKELQDPQGAKDDIWAIHSNAVNPKPHQISDPNWAAILQVRERVGGKLTLKEFRPIKPLGCGDTGSVHMVELKGTGKVFAMKAMEKEVLINRNKVHRVATERQILGAIDHPFLPTLYASIETSTHVCFINDFCTGGELYELQDKQPKKSFPEHVARYFAAEILLALEYLHCRGVIFRDLKPENILVGRDGHLVLTDFDLSFISDVTPELVYQTARKTGQGKTIEQESDSVSLLERTGEQERDGKPVPLLVAEPSGTSNSFVGTEEYIAPEIIIGNGHGSQVDWWSFGILIYEMMYGGTPFKGKNRKKTFSNILEKKITFPKSIPASKEAVDLIKTLLVRNPGNRLGSKYGASEIKQHPFFSGVDWALIRNKAPPETEVPVKHKALPARSDVALDWDESEV